MTGAAPILEKYDYLQSFQVDFNYPVHFTRNLFDRENRLLTDVLNRLREKRRHRFAVFIDDGVSRAHPDLARQIACYADANREKIILAAPPIEVPGGEAAKNGWTIVSRVIRDISALRLDRQSFVLAVGGGAVLDMVGFASAIIHRGVRLIRVPTTTLAQNDAGIGVKNGINDQGQKNFIGVFSPPFAVLNDSFLLTTLPFDQWIGGIAEAFKVAIIKDETFFRFLTDRAEALRNRDRSAMEAAIYRCAKLHLDHIRDNGDPFEFGSARPLDFGHWAAHKLESMSAYEIGHGQAVAVGICLDACIACWRNLITCSELDAVIGGFPLCGLPVYHPLLSRKKNDGTLEILDGLDHFREHLGGELTITLPKGIGNRVEVHEIDPEHVIRGIDFLAELTV